jgi:uncharacterized paraquat-inducible protein A
MMKALGIIFVVLGILCLLVGGVFTIFTLGFGIICSWPLLLVGLIFIVVGGVLSNEHEHVPLQRVIIHQESTQQGTTGSRFCTSCGGTLPSDAVFCPHCGKKI